MDAFKGLMTGLYIACYLITVIGGAIAGLALSVLLLRGLYGRMAKRRSRHIRQ